MAFLNDWVESLAKNGRERAARSGKVLACRAEGLQEDVDSKPSV